MTSVAAKCKACNNTAPANQFKLSHEHKMMVCPNCFSGKTKQLHEKIEKIRRETPPKPLGWDAEDEYLEKVTRLKVQIKKPKFERIPGTNQVRCICHNCEFKFKYDPFRKLPGTCPYCNSDIPKLRTFNLL